MKFKTWLENEDAAQTAFPASAEVLRTGLQPQVDAQEINTKQKEEHDQLLGIDGHVQRIKNCVNGMTTDSEKLKKIKRFLKNFLQNWEDLKSGMEGPEPQNGNGLGGLSLGQNQLSPAIGAYQQSVGNQ